MTTVVYLPALLYSGLGTPVSKKENTPYFDVLREAGVIAVGESNVDTRFYDETESDSTAAF